MVQINFALREVNCKIVYYGPGRSGKTTNLEKVHEKAPKGSIGEMVSIATETDRTLFFDFLPLDLGTVAGMNTKFQLYTVPGQVYYNATRKLVLQGADGVVFVADSQRKMHDENIESLQNLIENLAENGIDIAEIPLVIQYNKRDLDDLESVEEMNGYLNRWNAPFVEAVAVDGTGVFGTLKSLSSKVINQLNNDHGYSAGTPDRPVQPTVSVRPSPAPISSLPPPPVVTPAASVVTKPAPAPAVTDVPVPAATNGPAHAVTDVPASKAVHAAAAAEIPVQKPVAPEAPVAPAASAVKEAPVVAKVPPVAPASVRAAAPAPVPSERAGLAEEKGVSFIGNGQTVELSDSKIQSQLQLEVPEDIPEISESDDVPEVAPKVQPAPVAARAAAHPAASEAPASVAQPPQAVQVPKAPVIPAPATEKTMASSAPTGSAQHASQESQDHVLKREMERRRNQARQKEQHDIERIRQSAKKPIPRDGLNPMVYVIGGSIAVAVAFIVIYIFYFTR